MHLFLWTDYILSFCILFIFSYLAYLFVSCLSLCILVVPRCAFSATQLSQLFCQLFSSTIDLTAQAQQAQHHKHSTSSTIDLTAQDKPCRNTTLFHWICKTQATLCIFKCLVFMQILNSTGLVAPEIDGMIILQETVCLYKVFFLFWINVILVFYLFNGSIKYERESIKANRWIWMRE